MVSNNVRARVCVCVPRETDYCYRTVFTRTITSVILNNAATDDVSRDDRIFQLHARAGFRVTHAFRHYRRSLVPRYARVRIVSACPQTRFITPVTPVDNYRESSRRTPVADWITRRVVSRLRHPTTSRRISSPPR